MHHPLKPKSSLTTFVPSTSFVYMIIPDPSILFEPLILKALGMYKFHETATQKKKKPVNSWVVNMNKRPTFTAVKRRGFLTPCQLGLAYVRHRVKHLLGVKGGEVIETRNSRSLKQGKPHGFSVKGNLLQVVHFLRMLCMIQLF